MIIDDFKTLIGLTWGQVIDYLNVELPQTAYKSMPGAAKLTAINPTYMFEALTNCFGPYGLGWGLETADTPDIMSQDDRQSQTRQYTTWCVSYTHAIFWYTLVQGEELKIFEIPTAGYMENEDLGDALGGCRTACIGKAAKMLLWQQRVYKGEFKAKLPNDNLDMTTPGHFMITFGNTHNGETLAQIYQEDPKGGTNYIDWVMKNTRDASTRKAATEFLILLNCQGGTKEEIWASIFQSGVDYWGFKDIEKVKEAIREKFGNQAKPGAALEYIAQHNEKDE